VSLPGLPARAHDKDQVIAEALATLAPPALIAAARSDARSRTAIATPAGGREPIVTAIHHLPAEPARTTPFPARLDPRLVAVLQARGIHEPYTHQAEAIEHALDGRDVVVVTPTASGKTLCYNAPVLDAVLRNPASRALYLFPTKALAQDQLAELQGLCDRLEAGGALAVGAFTYDGDTPQDARRTVRTKAHVVLSNPDMLHSGILPHHPRWAKLFENLRFVVIDELHAYRGVFGSHLANILRRLQRICRHYGSDPVFIASSATIANPRELAERLAGRPFVVVDRSGAPRAEKFFVFVNPPVVNRQLGIRRSYLSEARRIALEFLERRLQVIVFTQSRLATEILTTYLKEALPQPPGAPDAVRGYRGGYLPNRRRDIERGLRDGVVRAVVSTSALELGIDIGALDAAILAGYPGTIASTWQRAGRAGRRSGRSAAVLVASSAPLDQFVVRHPEYFFGASPEHALVNPDNLHILLDHVKCAAFELPFTADETFGRENVQDVLALLAEHGFVHPAGGQWHWTHESYPADAVSLRSVSSDNFVVVDTTRGSRVIGETDYTSAPSTLHEKAIYIVEGQLYQVERLDFEGRKAYVKEVDCDYYTDAITYTKVTVLDEFAARDARVGAGGQAGPEATGRMWHRADEGAREGAPPEGTAARGRGAGAPGGAAGAAAGADRPLASDDGIEPSSSDEPAGGSRPDGPRASHGEVHVVSRVVGFKKIKFYTNENVGSGELDLPEQQMHTTAYWLTLAGDLVSALPFSSEERRDGVSGLAYAMRNVAQLLLMCDRQDIGLSVDAGDPADAAGGLDRSPWPAAVEPRIFIYDNYPGGIGFSEPLFSLHDSLIQETRTLIAGCPCESGCPACVGPAGEVGPAAKAVAWRILDALVAAM
jgi:DEAD/DEAH box helicase domain-containing protein